MILENDKKFIKNFVSSGFELATKRNRKNDWKPDSLEELRSLEIQKINQALSLSNKPSPALAQVPFGPCALALHAARLKSAVCSARFDWA